MIKLLQIYRIHGDDPSNAGVVKKCKAQQQAFRKLGMDADLISLCNHGILLNGELIFHQELRPHSLGIYWFYLSRFAFVILKKINFNAYDAIYFRHPFFDPSLVYMLRQAKRINPAIKIILEINTWPYDREPKRLLHIFSLRMDQFYRRKAHQFIDAVAHYGQEEKIWGIMVIPIRNGVEVSAIPLNRQTTVNDTLKLIAVGNWSYWHGLDRLLKGLAEFKTKGGKNISLKIVGGGSELNSYRSLISNLELDSWVEYCGTAEGKRLDQLFEHTDIGVGTLGMHRKGVALDSSLKHREYCARGLPFILSGTDPDFPAHLPFVHYITANESDVDIQEICSFYKKLSAQDPSYRKTVREYAERNLSWEKQLEPVAEWLKAGELKTL